jgi:hypothetical protein
MSDTTVSNNFLFQENNKARFLVLLRSSAHAIVLFYPLVLANQFHQSDSMLTQIATANHEEDFDMATTKNNTTKIGFSIQRFSTNGTEDIPFSDEQQDVFGDNYTAAHATYHVPTALMWVALLAPLVVGLVSKLVCNFTLTRKEFTSRLTRTYAKISSPILIFATILIVVPFFLLCYSDLCGPIYMELQYGPETDSSSGSSSSDESGDYSDDQEFEGTIALLHNGIPASCQIGWGGKVFLSWIVFYYPLLLMANGYVLLRTANHLDAEIANDKARVILSNSHGPVIKVLDHHDVHSDSDNEEQDNGGDTEDGSSIGQDSV